MPSISPCDFWYDFKKSLLKRTYVNGFNLNINELALKEKCERIKKDLTILKTIFSLLM